MSQLAWHRYKIVNMGAEEGGDSGGDVGLWWSTFEVM